jgi:hypothetical protein
MRLGGRKTTLVVLGFVAMAVAKGKAKELPGIYTDDAGDRFKFSMKDNNDSAAEEDEEKMEKYAEENGLGSVQVVKFYLNPAEMMKAPPGILEAFDTEGDMVGTTNNKAHLKKSDKESEEESEED